MVTNGLRNSFGGSLREIGTKWSRWHTRMLPHALVFCDLLGTQSLYFNTLSKALSRTDYKRSKNLDQNSPKVGWVLLCVHRNRRLIRDGSSSRPPRLSRTFTWTHFFLSKCWEWTPFIRNGIWHNTVRPFDNSIFFSDQRVIGYSTKTTERESQRHQCSLCAQRKAKRWITLFRWIT